MKRLTLRSVITLAVMLLTSITTSAQVIMTEELKLDEQTTKRINETVNLMPMYPANIPVGDSLIAVGKKTNNVGKRIAGELMVGIARLAMGDKKCKSNLEEAVQLSLANNLMNSYFTSIFYICNYYGFENQQYVLLQYSRQALKEAKKRKFKIGYAIAYYTSGIAFVMRDNPNLAMNYFEKAKKVLASSKDPSAKRYITLADLQLSSCYYALEKYDKAKEIIDKFSNSQDPNQRMQSIPLKMTIGYRCYPPAEYKKYYEQNIAIMRQVSDVNAQEAAIANYYMCTGDFATAYKHIEKINRLDNRLVVLEDYYTGLNDWKNAYKIKQREYLRKDSSIAKISSEDFTKMDAEIGNIQLRNQTEQQKMQTRLIIYGSVAALLLAVLIFMGIILYRNNKHNKILERKNDELRQARDEAEKARDAAEKASHVKSVFISNMTHELHSPLNLISGFAQVMADDSTPMEAAEYKDMAKSIKEGSDQLTKVLDNIIEVADKLDGKTELSDKQSVLK